MSRVLSLPPPSVLGFVRGSPEQLRQPRRVCGPASGSNADDRGFGVRVRSPVMLALQRTYYGWLARFHVTFAALLEQPQEAVSVLLSRTCTCVTRGVWN